MSDAPHVSSDALTSKPLALRMMPMPADLNPSGDVFGGWIMAMVDVAGAMPAIRRAGSRVVTVAVNSFVFKQPVGVGDIVSFHAEVAAVGKSSVTVDVEVFAERNPKAPEVVKVTEARLTYVAVSEDGAKRLIPAEAPPAEAPSCPLPTDWKVRGGMRRTVLATSEWGTARRSAHEIFERMLRQDEMRVIDEIEEGDTIRRVVNPTESAAMQEKADLIAFLKTLTDENLLTSSLSCCTVVSS
mgnify:CR=1 FL=1